MTARLFAAAIGVALALAVAANGRYDVVDRSPVHYTFTGDTSLDVDTTNGSVTVIADGGNTIRVDGERVIGAADQEEIARAKKDVTLDMNEKNGVAQFYENGPGRNNDRADGNHGFHDRSDRRYDVAYNLTAHVPRQTALRLRTVNGGVQAQGTSGAFDVRSVNGSIAMMSIAGSGAASSVNGATDVSFRENPKTDCSFTSVNGHVNVAFQPGLAADFSLKTVNGGMFTDFESTALASTAQAINGGKYIYKSRGEAHIRVGAGGPQLRLETVNGDIQIRKQAK